MYLHAHGPGVLAAKKNITTLSDLKGIKIRGTGLSAKIISNLGAVPISMGQGDTYEALQRGVVEATLCPIETLKGWRQAEVIDYVLSTKAASYTTTMYAIMNKDTWEDLPENIKEIFNRINAQWIEKQGMAWDTADEESKELLRNLGKPIITLTSEQEDIFVKAVNPMLEEYAAALEAKGLPGNAVLADLRELVKKRAGKT
jgi:TRAP-type C4-dicarboxylate transport system substrate-binding protein